jgi:hypothetical protein
MRLSRRARQKFAEFASGHGTLNAIEDAYAAHDFLVPADFAPPSDRQRRALCNAIEATINADDPAVAERLLRVYVDAIEDWGWVHDSWQSNPNDPKQLADSAKTLIAVLQRDGAPIDDEGRLAFGAGPIALPIDSLQRIDAPEVLHQHLQRINDTIIRDPAAAIGSAKELVESAFKIVLDDYGVTYKRSADLLELYKLVSAELRIARDSVPDSAKGSKASQTILTNLTTAVQNLAELRNELGLGHGRTAPSKALTRHARLAGDSAQTIASFVLATWHERRGSDQRPTPARSEKP